MNSCQICGKSSGKGRKVSHSNSKKIRRFRPNLHDVKVIEEGKLEKITICSKCLKKRRKKDTN